MVKSKREITFSLTKAQGMFFLLKCKYPLFVGGYGSGKTEALCNQAIYDALRGGSGSRIGLYAPTYDLVDLIIASRIKEKLDNLNIRYDHNRSKNIIHTKQEGMGDFILRTCDNPDRIVGYETYRAHIDELDTLKFNNAKRIWEKVIGRNRQKPKGMSDPFNRVSVYTTPEGFNFVHHQWGKSRSDKYDLVKASSYSNPFLPKDYIESLRETYSDELAAAYIDGEFVNLTFGTVYKTYNRVAHRSNEAIKPDETLFIGCDFNVRRMAATVYVKRDGGNVWHVVRELVDMYDTSDLVETIKSKFPTHKVVIYPDASGASTSSKNANVSDIDMLKAARFEVRVKRANPSVRDRINAMNQALSKGRIFINDAKCPTVADCLERQSYNKNNDPDKSSGHDHQNDATTYPIAYEMPISKPVAHFRVGVIGRQ